MGTIKFGWLALIALVAGAAGWLVNWWASRNGFPTPVLQLSSLITVTLIVAVTLFFGVRVLRWRNGKRDRPLNPVFAVWTLIFAQAAAYAGALSAGWHVGILLDQLALLTVRGNTGAVWGTLALIAGGIAMIAVGVMVEGFCRLPPDDDASAGKPTQEGEGEYA